LALIWLPITVDNVVTVGVQETAEFQDEPCAGALLARFAKLVVDRRVRARTRIVCAVCFFLDRVASECLEREYVRGVEVLIGNGFAVRSISTGRLRCVFFEHFLLQTKIRDLSVDRIVEQSITTATSTTLT
jgi:hypothetical protein